MPSRRNVLYMAESLANVRGGIDAYHFPAAEKSSTAAPRLPRAHAPDEAVRGICVFAGRGMRRSWRDISVKSSQESNSLSSLIARVLRAQREQ